MPANTDIHGRLSETKFSRNVIDTATPRASMTNPRTPRRRPRPVRRRMSRDARIKSAIETTSDAAGRDHAFITLKA
jgi:hypothetical protein